MSIKHLLLFFAIIAMASCGSKNSEAKNAARDSLEVPANVTPPVSAVPTSTGGNQQHYICSNNCEGSGGATAGDCPVCGQAYVHNQAYHAQNTPQINATSNGQPAPPPPSPSSGPNAAGEYHYKCSAGCSGGAGSQGKCASCGTDLVHNQAYHM